MHSLPSLGFPLFRPYAERRPDGCRFEQAATARAPVHLHSPGSCRAPLRCNAHFAHPGTDAHRPHGEKRFKCINPSINRCLTRKYACDAHRRGKRASKAGGLGERENGSDGCANGATGGGWQAAGCKLQEAGGRLRAPGCGRRAPGGARAALRGSHPATERRVSAGFPGPPERSARPAVADDFSRLRCRPTREPSRRAAAGDASRTSRRRGGFHPAPFCTWGSESSPPAVSTRTFRSSRMGSTWRSHLLPRFLASRIERQGLRGACFHAMRGTATQTHARREPGNGKRARGRSAGNRRRTRTQHG